MPRITVDPNSSTQLTLRPMPFMPGQIFNFHNATNVQIIITSQGKDIHLKEAS